MKSFRLKASYTGKQNNPTKHATFSSTKSLLESNISWRRKARASSNQEKKKKLNTLYLNLKKSLSGTEIKISPNCHKSDHFGQNENDRKKKKKKKKIRKHSILTLQDHQNTREITIESRSPQSSAFHREDVSNIFHKKKKKKKKLSSTIRPFVDLKDIKTLKIKWQLGKKKKRITIFFL